MRTHIQILAYIYLILGGVYVLGGVLKPPTLQAAPEVGTNTKEALIGP
jgi:hypothetical protein